MQEYFSIAEILSVNAPDLPKTTQGFSKKASNCGWRNMKDKVVKASGQTGGGGYLYHISLFSDTTQNLLALAFSNKTNEDFNPKSNHKNSDIWAHFNGLCKKQKQSCEARLNVLHSYCEFLNSKPKTTAINLAAKRHKVSARAVHRWLKMVDYYPRSDWLAALAPGYKVTSKRQGCHETAYEILKSDYLRAEKPSFSKCYRRMVAAAKEAGWSPVPNEIAMRRLLNSEVPKSVQILARSGADTAKTLYPAQRRSREHLHAMHSITMDGHKFDVFVKMPGRSKPTRVIMVAVQDLYSNKILAWRLSETENKDTVRLVIGDMVHNFGIPEVAYLDNGRAFTSKAISGGVQNRFRFKAKDDELKGLMVSLGIQIKWTQPYSGQSKPIERAFGDLADAISKHPFCAGAYTGNTPDAKPENYGQKAIDFDDFKQHVDAQIAEHNARTGRRGSSHMNGRSFNQVFDESLQNSATIIRWATKEQRALWLMASEKVKCRKGSGEIILFDNRYWAVELNGLAGQSVTVRYDPQDLTRPVLVYDHDDKLICEAGLVEDTKFDDVDAAREHNRDRNELMRALRTQRDIHRKFNPNQLADFYQSGGTSGAKTSQQPSIPKVKRLVPKKQRVVNGSDQLWDEQMENAFSRGMDELKTDNILNFKDFKGD